MLIKGCLNLISIQTLTDLHFHKSTSHKRFHCTHPVEEYSYHVAFVELDEMDHVAALVRSHMNGLNPFVIGQTTELMPPSPQKISAYESCYTTRCQLPCCDWTAALCLILLLLITFAPNRTTILNK